jgi:hypothetical protein
VAIEKAGGFVMGIDLAGEAEPMTGKALLDAVHHGVDAGVAVALHQRIEIVCMLTPGAGDQIATGPCVGLVPHRDIAVDQVADVAHVWLLVLRRSAWSAVPARGFPPTAARSRLTAR